MHKSPTVREEVALLGFAKRPHMARYGPSDYPMIQSYSGGYGTLSNHKRVMPAQIHGNPAVALAVLFSNYPVQSEASTMI